MLKKAKEGLLPGLAKKGDDRAPGLQKQLDEKRTLPGGLEERLPGDQWAVLSGFRQADGEEPWSFDGTTLTLFAAINPGMAGSFPFGFTEFNNALYFSASDGAGRELWKEPT